MDHVKNPVNLRLSWGEMWTLYPAGEDMFLRESEGKGAGFLLVLPKDTSKVWNNTIQGLEQLWPNSSKGWSSGCFQQFQSLDAF